jgi:hypothetical protein
MTVVKSVSDGLRDCESETQLNLDRTLRISACPTHLSQDSYDAVPEILTGVLHCQKVRG